MICKVELAFGDSKKLLVLVIADIMYVIAGLQNDSTVATISVFLWVESTYLKKDKQGKCGLKKKKASCLGNWYIKNSFSRDRLVYKDTGMYWVGKTTEGNRRMHCVTCLHSLLAGYFWCLFGISWRRGFASRGDHVIATNTIISLWSTFKWCLWGEGGRELFSLSCDLLNKIPK